MTEKSIIMNVKVHDINKLWQKVIHKYQIYQHFMNDIQLWTTAVP